MSRYSVYNGKFHCQVCGLEVRTLRSYYDDKKLTWLCKNNHFSHVSLNTRKTKKDYEREIGK
jgi:hypothetical protein